MIRELISVLVVVLATSVARGQSSDTEFGLWCTNKQVVDIKSGDSFSIDEGAHLFEVNTMKRTIVYYSPSKVQVPFRIHSSTSSLGKVTWILDDSYFDKIVLHESETSGGNKVDLFFKRGRTYFHFDKVKKTY